MFIKETQNLSKKKRNLELNIFHVACFNAHYEVVHYLIEKAIDIQSFINSPINDYRNSTSLEETFKGFLSVDSEKGQIRDRQALKAYNDTRSLKIIRFKRIINLLIENNAKFSKNFIQNNGLSKLLTETFSGPSRDTEIVHCLYCFNFLFKYKLREIFFYDIKTSASKSDSLNISIEFDSKETYPVLDDCKEEDILNDSRDSLELVCKLFDLEKTIDEFLLKIYIISQRVVKDHKRSCLNYFIELLFSLHYSGQLGIQMSKLSYLKEKNIEIYHLIEAKLNRPLSLKSFSIISIRNTIKSFGESKIECLEIPSALKNDLFLMNIPTTKTIQNSYYTYLF